MHDFEIHFGLVKPEKEPKSVDEMRIAIQKGRRDSALISNALNIGEFRGMSGEDTYVMLAYRALIELERIYRLNMRWMNTQVTPGIRIPVSTSGDDR